MDHSWLCPQAAEKKKDSSPPVFLHFVMYLTLINVPGSHPKEKKTMFFFPYYLWCCLTTYIS